MAKKATLGFSTLALLLVVFGAYYLYLSERESYFIDRNFRLLALWSNKLSEMVEEEFKHQFQYIISVSSENDDEQDTCGKTKLQQECQPVQCLENANKEGDDKTPVLCKFEKEFEKQNKQREKKLSLVSLCSKPQELPLNTFVNDQPHIKTQLSSKDKDLLRLIYEGKREKHKRLCKDTFCNHDDRISQIKDKHRLVCKDTIQVDLSISKLLRRLVTDQAFNDTIITEHAFSDVIVFDSETGTVHFQANHSQANHSSFRLDDFRDLVAQRPDTRGLFSFFSESSETTKIENNKSGSSKSLPLKDLLQNPTHQQMIIGDISYELFTQPIVLSELTIKKQTHDKQLVIATDVGTTELTLQHYKKDDPARLILAGFVKTEKFQSEYRAIPHTSLLIFLLFVLMGLLSLPIIHLGFMDEHERLSRIHVFSLLVTCISGTALLTLLFLDVVWLNNVRHSLDKQLKETAQHIKKTFSYELTQSLNLLHAYDHSEAFEEDFAYVTQSKYCPIVDLSDLTKESNRKCGGTSKKDRWVARKEYPYLCNEKHKKIFPYHCDYNPVFWVDRDKNVRIIWTPQSEYYFQTSKVSLAHREYVKRILAPEPRRSLWYTKDVHPAFYVQSLLSLEAGNHTVVFSMESSRPEGKPKKWVAAIETEFQFLKAEAIPDGTGFAVIEDDGSRVLFHSDDNRSLWENFFEETDDNAQLKAHVFSRTAGKAEGNYWGKGHSFYSTPLPGVPWSLVVFRNKELFRTTNFEALLLAGTLFALYTVFSVVLAILLLVIWRFNKTGLRKMFISWFWPDSDRYYWCYATIGLIFFLVGIPLFWYDIFPDDCAVWFVFPYLLVSLIFLYLLIKVCPRRTEKISPKQSHRQYAFVIISFLLLFSALPMGIFFKVGTDREMALAMKYNLITLGHKLRQTPNLDFSQIQREIRGVDTSKSIDECSEDECDAVKCERTNSQEEGYPLACPEQAVFRNDRTLSTHSIHLSPITTTSLYVSDHDPSPDPCCPPKPPLLEKLHKLIRANSLSRLSNPVSISTLGLIDDQSPGNPFQWRYDSPTSVALDFQVPLKPSDSQSKWVILRSSPPSDVWSLCAFLAERPFLGAIVLPASALVLVLIPIFIISRIFPIPQNSPTNENSNKKEEKLLIIGSPESLDSYRQEKLPAHRWGKIDCHLISNSLEWWKMKRKVLPIRKGKARVILDHFEYQLGVPQYDHAKLELLAALLAKVKEVCVLSTINPLKLAHKDDPGLSSPDASKGPAPASLQEWSQVFQAFTVRYYKQDRHDKPDKKDKPKISADPRSALADEPSYEAIWQSRTLDEKITLHCLSKDGIVHAKNPDLPTLLDLGLIKSKPDPHWLDKNFEEYVLNAAQRDRLDTKERVKSHAWKWPIAIVLVVLVLGLLSTQQEFHNAVVIVLSLLPVLLPTLSELFGGQQKGDNIS